jgi:5-oxoprolinase (ATP-hydrolysing) subunit C
MTCWEVIAPGVLTTVQDQGREGWRHLGVSLGGALDRDAAELANRLVGNVPDAAVLELTLQGPTLTLPQPARIAIVGAVVAATCNGQPLPGHRPVTVPAGELKLGALREGIRAWLAVAGGFHVPEVLGSRSTDLRGGFGGVAGRALRVGDQLPLGEDPGVQHAAGSTWWIGSEDCALGTANPVRYLPATHPGAAALAGSTWSVHADSNRQGIRLTGAPLRDVPQHNVSEPVAVGCIQLPPDGQPIVLLADAQTVGGYARLGHVIAADLPRLAQAGAGAVLSFAAIDREQAGRINSQHRHRQARTALAIQQRLARRP